MPVMNDFKARLGHADVLDFMAAWDFVQTDPPGARWNLGVHEATFGGYVYRLHYRLYDPTPVTAVPAGQSIFAAQMTKALGKEIKDEAAIQFVDSTP